MQNHSEALQTSTDDLFPELISSPAASPVRTSARPASKSASVVPAPACFTRLCESQKIAVLESSSWKTLQICLPSMGGATLEPFSGNWPRSGTMRSGTAYRLPTLAHTTEGTEYGLWPTPCAVDHKEVFRSKKTLSRQIQNHQAKWPHAVLMEHYSKTDEPGHAHPEFAEWLMGYPIGYTDLNASGTPWSRRSWRTLPRR